MSKRQNFYFDEVKTSLIITFKLKWPTLKTGPSAGMVFLFVVCCVPKIMIYNSMQFKIGYTTSSPSKLNFPASNTEAKI